jgi:hypothetical protein
VTFAAGYTAIYQALLAIFIGLAIYPFLKARRERLGQIPALADIASQPPGWRRAHHPYQAPAPAPAPRRRGTRRHWHQPEPGRTVMTFSVQSEVGQL